MGAVFLVIMDATLQPLALGGIEEGFGTSRTATAWVLSAYSISLATFVVAAGRLADRSGRKRAFLVGLALFVLGGVGGWMAPELWVLVLCRAVQGAGSAFVMPASIGLILAVWPEDDQTRAITSWTAVGGIAGALAPLVGGGLIDIWGWRAAYLLSVIIGTPSFLAARALLTDTERKVTSRFPDLVGALMVAASLGLLTLSLVQGRTWGWGDPRIIVAFALAVVLIPLIRQRILGHPAPIVLLAGVLRADHLGRHRRVGDGASHDQRHRGPRPRQRNLQPGHGGVVDRPPSRRADRLSHCLRTAGQRVRRRIARPLQPGLDRADRAVSVGSRRRPLPAPPLRPESLNGFHCTEPSNLEHCLTEIGDHYGLSSFV